MVDKLFELVLRLVVKGNGVLCPQGTQAHIYAGHGTPEGVIVAEIGSLYLRTNGSTGTSLYVKESGSGNTGWIAK